MEFVFLPLYSAFVDTFNYFLLVEICSEFPVTMPICVSKPRPSCYLEDIKMIMDTYFIMYIDFKRNCNTTLGNKRD